MKKQHIIEIKHKIIGFYLKIVWCYSNFIFIDNEYLLYKLYKDTYIKFSTINILNNIYQMAITNLNLILKYYNITELK